MRGALHEAALRIGQLVNPAEVIGHRLPPRAHGHGYRGPTVKAVKVSTRKPIWNLC
ncbi:MAG: hypothetical protein LC676_08030 [Loktanella sp.]|nr:hypothetical protein [Loktanella sp.]